MCGGGGGGGGLVTFKKKNGKQFFLSISFNLQIFGAFITELPQFIEILGAFISELPQFICSYNLVKIRYRITRSVVEYL